MRPVKAARARSQQGRGRVNRGNARSSRVTGDRNVFGRRKHNDSLSLFLASMRSRLKTGRPILWLTACCC
jgi:hypothetical protein